MADRDAVVASAFGHVGLCVADLERSQRFYVELFGFEVLNTLTVPDSPADRLLRIQAPLGLRVVYLRKEGLVLELLSFERAGNPEATERVLNQPGLTHLSFSVEAIDAVALRCEELGGRIIGETKVGGGVFLQDPDGQLIELYPSAFRPHLYG